MDNEHGTNRNRNNNIPKILPRIPVSTKDMIIVGLISALILYFIVYRCVYVPYRRNEIAETIIENQTQMAMNVSNIQ